MNDQQDEFPPFIKLVIPQSGLATLMPCWKTLEGLSRRFPSSDRPSLVEQQDPLEAPKPARILVIIHAYDPDSLSGLFQRLKGLDALGDIVITTDTQDKARKIEDIHLNSRGGSARLQVEVTPNHGRDVWPFWRVLEKYGAGFEFFLKLHLKRSTHWEDLGYWDASVEGIDAGSAWNHDCFHCLIPSSDTECRSLLGWMRDHRLGAIYPRPHRIVSDFGWGNANNMVMAAGILEDLGIDPLSLLKPLCFPAGNMFWGTMASFMPFVPYFVDPDLYPLEPIPLDGTFLHAVERCYSYLLNSADDRVGFLFPAEAGADSFCLRGVTIEALISGGPEACRLTASTEPLHLHRLYTAPARQWRERAHGSENDLLSLKEVLRSMEQSKWGKVKAFMRGLVGKR